MDQEKLQHTENEYSRHSIDQSINIISIKNTKISESITQKKSNSKLLELNSSLKKLASNRKTREESLTISENRNHNLHNTSNNEIVRSLDLIDQNQEFSSNFKTENNKNLGAGKHDYVNIRTAFK